MNLSDLQSGQRGVIVKVAGHGGIRKRLIEMGFVRGKTVRVVRGAPLRDPVEYEIMGYRLSLRRSEARLVEIISEEEVKKEREMLSPLDTELPSPAENDSPENDEETSPELEGKMRKLAADRRRTITIALVGNPNCGKTSIFNRLSGGHEHVGNYSGVTVEAKEGTFEREVRVRPAESTVRAKSGCFDSTHSCSHCTSPCLLSAVKEKAETRRYRFRIIDLPGTYSLSAYSPEELYVRKYLIEELPDVIVNVLDSSNLERNLYLTTQLIDMNLPMVVSLNIYDELLSRGDKLDHRQLSRLLGVPLVPTISRTGEGIDDLLEAIVAVYEHTADESLARHIHINHSGCLEQSIDRIKHLFQENKALRDKFSTRFLAIKFLEGDPDVQNVVESLPNHDALVAARFDETRRIKEELRDTPENALCDAKYGFINGALLETYRPHDKMEHHSATERIDRIVTHRFLGYPLFFLLLALVFSATFWLGAYPMEWIDQAVGVMADFVSYVMPAGMWRDLVSDGIIGGVGSVIVFLPNILILYTFISILEDSGYMARAAFIMDSLMHRIGLHGKSFIPMVMGFGCNVPAVMATRTIESPKSRLVTMLIIPFMSCSARIPVFVILISAFFPRHQGLMMFSLYVGGILVAILMSKLLNRFLGDKGDYPFVMELPPYRFPAWRTVLRHTWEKGRQYLQKMGGIILISSVCIWALCYFPRPSTEAEVVVPTAESESTENIKVATPSNHEHEVSIADAPTQPAATQSVSYLERIGSTIAPVFRPLGFDWQMTVGILAGVGAKELVVSTLSVMYAKDAPTVEADETVVANDGAAEDEEMRLSGLLRGKATSAAALAYLVFILCYFPCIATLIAIKNESGSWKWAALAATYTTLTAYVLAWLVHTFIGPLL